MDSKLTLKLDTRVINKAKKYASSRKVSLSRLIENYLDSITSQEIGDFEISPFVRSIFTGKSIPADIDYKTDYTEYIEKKYQ